MRFVPESDLVTTVEAAPILGKSPRTVQRMAEAGRLPYVHKSGGSRGQYLFSRQVVELIADRDRKPVAS